MRHLLLFFLLFPAIFSKTNTDRHSRVISGLVIAQEERSAMPGVLVYVKGTKNISGTQQDGMYYIEVTEADSVLVFRSEGYQPKEVRLTSACEYNVALCKYKD